MKMKKVIIPEKEWDTLEDIECPYCSACIDIDYLEDGDHIQCDECLEEFVVTKEKWYDSCSDCGIPLRPAKREILCEKCFDKRLGIEEEEHQ